MVEFKLKTEGSKPIMTIVSWPPVIVLLVIVCLSVLLASIVTQNTEYQQRLFNNAPQVHETPNKLEPQAK